MKKRDTFKYLYNNVESDTITEERNHKYYKNDIEKIHHLWIKGKKYDASFTAAACRVRSFSFTVKSSESYYLYHSLLLKSEFMTFISGVYTWHMSKNQISKLSNNYYLPSTTWTFLKVHSTPFVKNITFFHTSLSTFLLRKLNI